MFKEKYAAQRLRIGLGDLPHANTDIYEPNTIIKVLERFGPGISNLDLFCKGFDERYVNGVVRLINNCSCSSLTDFSMTKCQGNIWQEMQNPFENVKTFAYSVDAPNVGNDCKRFNELFPNLFTLRLQNFMAPDGCHADNHFPNLKALILQRQLADYPEFGSSFQKVIEKNPQVQGVIGINLSQLFLQFISKWLPKLNSLQLMLLPNSTEAIEFPNVEIFSGTYVAPDNLNFPKLKILELNIHRMYRDNCIKFLQNHKNINRFHLVKGSEFDYKLFDGIKNSLVNLLQMEIDESQLIPVKTLIDFMEQHAHLLEVSLGYCTAPAKQILRDELKEHWNIQDYSECLKFQRKHLIQNDF